MRDFDGRWKLVFRREPVIDRDDHRRRLLGNGAAHSVVRIQVAEYETAAVEVNQRGSDTPVPGRIKAHGHIAFWSRHREIFHTTENIGLAA